MAVTDIGLKQPAASQSSLRTYLRLLSYVRPHRGMFGLGVGGMALFAATNAGTLWFTKKFLDGTFGAKDPTMIWLVPVGIVVLFLLRGIGDFVQTYCPGYVGRRIIKQLRGEIFDRFLNLPIAYFDRNASGILLSRLTYNTEQVAQAATDSVTTFIGSALNIIGLLAYLFYINAKLTAIALLIVPVVAYLVRTVNRLFRRYSKRIQSSMGDVTRVAKEAVEAPRVIKVFNAQTYQKAQFDTVNERNRRSNMKLLRTKGLSNPVVQLIAAIGLAMLLRIATGDALAGHMTVGEFTTFIGALASITAPLRSLVNVAGPLQQGIAAGESIFELLDEACEPASGGRELPRARGSVEFRDLEFGYETGKSIALHGVSFKVAAGETVAIVGSNGSGKSTLVNLLPRFYEIKSGSILIDDHDIRDYRIHDLREQIALVSQDVVLFNDTIANNIKFGRTASNEAVENAARAAHVLEFVSDLPERLDTVVGDRGVLFSGGQRQRIAIARALLKNAPILILDEATSALDNEVERNIQAALEELMKDRTTLVIAHRLATVEKADRIVVLDKGRLVEMGTHAELIAKDGRYASLHRAQFNG